MSTSIISSIRDFLKTCPLLEGDAIRINYLGAEPIEYTIDEVPTEPILKRYTDGGTVRQVLFILASSQYYSRDVLENLKACGAYEELANWLEIQNNKGNLPVLPNGLEARTIEAITNGYCISADIMENVQRYQIQCKLTYYKEAI